jgi:hypothetical protein
MANTLLSYSATLWICGWDPNYPFHWEIVDPFDAEEEAFIARFPLCIQDTVRRELMAGMIDPDNFDLARDGGDLI